MLISGHTVLAPPRAGQVRVAVLTVSDTRTAENDEGGALIESLSREAGFSIQRRDLVPDDVVAIRDRVSGWAEGAEVEVDAILCTGGTGVAPRDRTVEAVVPLFDRSLNGFGELFRALSFSEIGPAAMLSRATAGIVGKTAIFLMPGSPGAVRMAMERLILPALAHLVGELRRERGSHHQPHHHATHHPCPPTQAGRDDSHDP